MTLVPSGPSEAGVAFHAAAAVRRSRVPSGPAALAGSRSTPWGKPGWSISTTILGAGADCRCHRDTVDLPAAMHCKKSLPLAKRDPIWMEEARRLAKVWLLVGEAVALGHTARNEHVSMNPRHHFVGWSEAGLDIYAVGLP